ncbi:MAG: TolB family protein [Clostridia bacterium]|nr:TolB family protein [Clostridia bacterium]
MISRLECCDIEKNERTVLCEINGHIEAPNWPEENTLIYNSEGHLFEYDIAAKTHTMINTGFADRCNNDHLPSADGKHIAISHGTREDGRSRVYIVPRKGGTPRLITALGPSYLHGWSPDGSRLCYCAERNGEYDVYDIPAEGGVERQLTNAPGLNDGCEYSPDGKYIWFNSVRTGLMQIYRMEADGSGQTQMTFGESNNWFAHVSPDGKHVVYLAYKKGDVAPGSHPGGRYVTLRLMSPDGSEDRELTAVFGGQGTINVNSWAPDSKRFAFVSYDPDDLDK